MTEDKKPKLFLIFHGRFPGEKAAALFAAKSAESFSDAGFEATLLVPRRLGRSREKYSDYYGIKPNFKAVFLPVIDLFFWKIFSRIAFLKSYFSFSLSSLAYLLLKADKKDIIYSNEALPLFLASCFFPRTVYEMHDYPDRKKSLWSFFLKRMKAIVSTNKWKKEKLSEDFKISPEKIFYEPNAADLKAFSLSISAEDARKTLLLPSGKFVITYVGSLRTMGMEKGIDTVLKTASLEKGEDSIFLFVGGNAEDVEFYKKKSAELGAGERTFFAGSVRHSDIPLYLRASDILLAPFPKGKHYEYFMSPMKIFEYMMSGRPIIATSLPSIREILNERNSFIISPDDDKELFRTIFEIKKSKDKGEIRAGEAYKDATKYTWEKRALRIKEFLNKNSNF